ncbi:MAG: hypothetical protein LBC07_00420 [Elusimicrobiota bacterium]|nr:hypothetical protein [Elusimicrobiota bacterium]
MDRLDVFKNEVTENISDSGLEGFAKGVLTGAAIGSVVPGTATLISDLAVGDSMEK